jgi:hypothetical protein
VERVNTIAGTIPGEASARRLAATLRHEQPDRIPIDLGSTAVTGIHVSCVSQLRDYFGLARRPVKIHEPYQMLGWMDEDLVKALGIDTVGVFPRENMFGFANENWKEWNFRGLDVLIGEKFRIVEESNGDILVFPKGDPDNAPSDPSTRTTWTRRTIWRNSATSPTRTSITLHRASIGRTPPGAA